MTITHRWTHCVMLLGLALLLGACGAATPASPGAASAEGTVAAQLATVAPAPSTSSIASTPATAEASGSASISNADSTTSGKTGSCLPATEISDIVGIPVRVFPDGTISAGTSQVCAYEVTDTSLGAFVSIVVQPASESGNVLEEVQSAAKSLAGVEAEPIDVGEGGFAYGSSSKSEAVAVAGGKVYSVDLTSAASADLGDKKDAMIEILKKVVP